MRSRTQWKTIDKVFIHFDKNITRYPNQKGYGQVKYRNVGGSNT